jgi:uncharacterized protein YggE
MKKIILIIAFISIGTCLQAQNLDIRKKIEVSGMAEQEVTPDEIYFSISIKEYLRDNKKKVTLSDLELQLQKAVIKAGVAEKDFTINNMNGYNNYWDKKKDPTFLASKQYSLKLKNLNSINEILESIDPKGIAYTNIDRYDYSKKEELKKELRIKALLLACEKATYLVESLGDKLGSVLHIAESGNESYPPIMYSYKTAMSTEMASADSEMANIEFKTIKIMANVNAVFEIK